MIRKVRFSNFYSFDKEQEISFLAKKKKTYDYFNSDSRDQITKIAGFVGSNASGKTNIMRLFSFLSYFVSRDVKDGETAFIPNIVFKTFFGNNQPSDFHIEFEVNNTIYFYSFSIRDNVILNESLYLKEIKKRAKKILVFARDLDKVTLNEVYFKNLSIQQLPKTRDDISLITSVKKSIYTVEVIDVVYNYFSGFKTNINERGDINHIAHQFSILHTYLKKPDLKAEMEQFVRDFDIGLSGIDIKKDLKDTDQPDIKQLHISLRGIHTTKASNKMLPFEYESRGTQSLFFTMANILNALHSNQVIIIDEIECGLHPEALNKLLGYFISQNKDSKAQMIFSSHSLGFMNKLDMHQIFLVEKNREGESSVYRLNDVKGIRPDENFFAKYMSGSYGAFPKIRI